MSERLSVNQYARHRGVSPAAVVQAAKKGFFQREPDGSIDPAKADAAWQIGTQQSQKSVDKVRAVPDAAVGSVKKTLSEKGIAPSGNISFVEARTAHEIVKAHLARLKLQERQAELINRAEATMIVYELARDEREAWINWPARISGELASELGVEQSKLITVLEKHVRAHLIQLGDMKVKL